MAFNINNFTVKYCGKKETHDHDALQTSNYHPGKEAKSICALFPDVILLTN